MNGSTEHRASDAGEQTSRPQVVLNLGTARRMLPLVKRIVADVLVQKRLLDMLGSEQERLDRHRFTLDWPKRQRRYEVHEEYAVARRAYEDVLAELEVLGIVLVVADEGRVGLPTVVNGKLAFFSWKPAEAGLLFWHFPGEKVRRPIPSSWNENGAVQIKSNA